MGGNERLHLVEVACTEMRDAMSRGEHQDSLAWAHRGIQVCHDDPWCKNTEMNTRAWMIDRLGHQDGHVVLDSRIIVKHFFDGVFCTPDEAVQAGRDAWVALDRAQMVRLQKLKSALVRLEGLAPSLLPSDQLRLQPWFAVRQKLL